MQQSASQRGLMLEESRLRSSSPSRSCSRASERALHARVSSPVWPQEKCASSRTNFISNDCQSGRAHSRHTPSPSPCRPQQWPKPKELVSMVELECDLRWLDHKVGERTRSATPKGKKLAGDILSEMRRPLSRSSSRHASPAPTPPPGRLAFAPEVVPRGHRMSLPPPRIGAYIPPSLLGSYSSPSLRGSDSADNLAAPPLEVAQDSQTVPDWVHCTPVIDALNQGSARLRESSFSVSMPSLGSAASEQQQGQVEIVDGDTSPWSVCHQAERYRIYTEMSPCNHEAEVIKLDSGTTTPSSPMRSAAPSGSSMETAASSPGEAWAKAMSAFRELPNECREHNLSAQFSEASISQPSEVSTKTSSNKAPAPRETVAKSAARPIRPVLTSSRKLAADAVPVVRIEKRMEKRKGQWR